MDIQGYNGLYLVLLSILIVDRGHFCHRKGRRKGDDSCDQNKKTGGSERFSKKKKRGSKENGRFGESLVQDNYKRNTIERKNKEGHIKKI